VRLLDLNAAAMAAGVEIPARAPNHLHPRMHAEWNRRLFEDIRASAWHSCDAEACDPGKPQDRRKC